MKNYEELEKKVIEEVNKLQQGQDENAPTGKCEITTVFGTTCTDGLTLNGCNTVASRAGGTAAWTEGAQC